MLSVMVWSTRMISLTEGTQAPCRVSSETVMQDEKHLA